MGNGPVMFVLCSRTDTRSLLSVHAELVSRGVAAACFAGDGPERAGIEVLAREAGVPLRFFGEGVALNADAALSSVKPSTLVLGADSLYLTRRLIDAARRARVPSVLVQEAANEYTPDARVRKSLRTAVLDAPRALFRARLMVAHRDWAGLARLVMETVLARRRVVPGYGFAQTDVFCVADEAVGTVYRDAGSRARRFAATGIPHLIPTIPAQASIDHDFVVLTQPFELSGFVPPGRTRRLYHEIVASLKRVCPDARVLGKLHPVESPADYAGVAFDAIEPDLATAIARARVSVSVHSAALAVAMAHSRPAIAFIPPWLNEGADNMIVRMLDDRGRVARDAESFAAIAARASSCDHDDVPPAFPLCTDGGAARRIADEIVALARRGVSHRDDAAD